MKIVEKITKLIEDSLSKQGIDFKGLDIIIEIPNEPQNGEYSTNIAMKLSSQLKRNPLEIAKDIVENIDEDGDIEKIDFAKPGFINFHLSNRYFLTDLTKMVEGGDDYFKFNIKKDKEVVIEYTDANPFKELHIGHLYSNNVGESFARLQEALGADVKRACYQGDVGLHVAKALWGLEKKLNEENISFEEIEELPLEQKVKYLGDAYVLGAEYYDELKDASAIEEIVNINYYIFSLTLPSLEKKDFSKYEEINLSEKYQKGRQWCLDFFEKIYEKLGTKFDYYFFESEVGEAGLKIVLDNIGKIFEKDEGSVIYRGDEKKNLHTRVFINSHNLPTYEAKEIGLALRKSETLDFDESIVITADEQSGYFRVVLDALSKIDPSLSEKTRHIAHGKVKLPGSIKMSSRKGGILAGEWLIEETQKRIIEIMRNNENVDEDLLEEISEKIAVGAIKYAFLKVGVGRDIVFDFDKSITFDGDTGPYLMYVYSRCKSILRDAESSDSGNICLDSCLSNPDIKRLVVDISKYKTVLLDSATNYSPSTLCQYLFDLGQSFNAFYQNVRILDAQEEDKQILLLIVEVTMKIMKNGLNNLGIDVVEKM